MPSASRAASLRRSGAKRETLAPQVTVSVLARANSGTISGSGDTSARASRTSRSR
jgi:hypothetical protein